MRSSLGRRRVLLSLGLLFWGAVLAAGAAAQQWQAGTAVVSITPRPQDLDGGLYLGGYGGYQERGAALGIARPIHARALALTDGDEVLLLLTVDAVGIDNQLLDRMRAGASTATGWPEDRIWIAATHTHAAPDLQGLWGGTPASYRAYVALQGAQAARIAVANLEPAELAAASVRAPGLGVNRRGWAFTDETLSLLVARRPQGPTLAMLVNVGIHPTILGPENRLISPDWVGPMLGALEEWHGGTALFINGVLGDVVPAAPLAGAAGATEFGLRVARQVEAALSSLPRVDGPGGGGREGAPAARPLPAGATQVEWVRLEPELAVSVGEITLPVQNEALVEALRGGLLMYEVEESGGSLAVTTRVGRVSLGTAPAYAEMLTVPGEAVTRLGIQLRGLVQSPVSFLLGLTHDSLGYFVPWDEWMTGRNGDYEESVSLGVNAAVLLHQALSILR